MTSMDSSLPYRIREGNERARPAPYRSRTAAAHGGMADG